MNPQSEMVCLLPKEAFEARVRLILAEVFDKRTAVSELENGYELTFVGEAAQIQALTALIIQERECCPFLQFGLTFLPNQGNVQLSISGGEGVKAYLRTLLFGKTAVSSSE